MKETLKKIPFLLLSHFFLLHNFDGQRLEVLYTGILFHHFSKKIYFVILHIFFF